MGVHEFTDEVVAKVEAHGVYRVGYPDRQAADRLVRQLREAIAAERKAMAELVEAAKVTLNEPWEIDRLRAALAALEAQS